MVNSVLDRDIDTSFPQITVLKASAGSGKTYALTERFVQFILSEKIPKNHLRNILAITFSNNASKEMKGRIISWLKEVYIGNPDKISQLLKVISLDEKRLVERAEVKIDEILLNFTDFQVKTIDSFMTSIYKASAIDLGESPDFEIIMALDKLMIYAFNRYLRKVKAGSNEAIFLENLLKIISDGRGSEAPYLWDPSKSILEEIKELYSKLSLVVKDIKIPDEEDESDSISIKISKIANKLDNLIDRSGLKRSERSSLNDILEVIKMGRYPDLIGKGLRSPPVIKPKDSERDTKYKHILKLWEELGDLVSRYTHIHSFRYYVPYLKIYETFKDILDKTKREEESVFIDDINKKLSYYLTKDIIPDIYFRIGETIYHYLIDEFQDTSPIQWINLYPLIENSLSQGGSLFVVGDTKQAIYGFRDADYRIMREMELKNPFPSADHKVKQLEENYRSLEKVIKFNEEFFHRIVPAHDEYKDAAERSGLTDFFQIAKGYRKGPGYVDVRVCERSDDGADEKIGLQNLIKELRERGYRYSDIAILTKRNEDVVNITTWLNEIDVPFISYSSLDIRMRKLTEEILFLLTFLDSPPDNLSFSGFILGEIFRESLSRKGIPIKHDKLHEFIFRNRRNGFLYKIFQKEFPEIWECYFDNLFRSTGYLPLYELINEIYRIFEVFKNFPEEEATLIKILEVVKDFERQGLNNPKEFLKVAYDEITDSARWNIDLPEGIDAVRVMTIHKAKGLGFPVVILILYGEQSRGFKYILNEMDDGVYLLKINRDISRASKFLEKAYEDERMKEMVNRLNTLYVGFTRSESELYIIGVLGKRRKYPVDLLKEVNFTPMGEKVLYSSPKESDQIFLKSHHHLKGIDFSSFSSSEELNIEERRRGEFIHRVLSLIEYTDEGFDHRLREIIVQVMNESNIEYPVNKIHKEILEFISSKDIRPYFNPRKGRVIKKEQRFSDPEGNLLIMDRIIIDEESVTVIDYKTGSERRAEDRYINQVKNYMKILKDIYPDKRIEGMIAYTDLKEVFWID